MKAFLLSPGGIKKEKYNIEKIKIGYKCTVYDVMIGYNTS